MEVRNRDGEPVDAVPFLVSTGIFGMLTISVGPLYGLAYGVPVARGLAVSAGATAAIAAVAFHRLVWVAPPAWVTIPPEVRFQRLVYLGVAFGLALLALTAPLAV
ncbi:hypothetical protein [Halobellus ruber]|uniref:Uncharacterized protein n=1 Tax=Halobellus ruber TaxID=2761102 RepID=A0A7J9SFK6_9EURY|nr:hypothetical protein [Halobellus ruber]MBB6644757.1 hypothetical protein [Halobellus ruber]